MWEAGGLGGVGGARTCLGVAQVAAGIGAPKWLHAIPTSRTNAFTRIAYSRMIAIQAALTERALELLALPQVNWHAPAHAGSQQQQ